MKKHSSFCKVAVVCLTTAMSVSHLVGAESTTYAPDPVDRAGDESTWSGPDPGRIGSMAGVGAKPRKADLEKMRGGAAQGTQTQQAARPSAADREFITRAARESLHRVQMGQMAVQRAQSEAVKKLGRRVAADHARTNEQLRALAARHRIKPDVRVKKEAMSKSEMENFDRAWVAKLINAHQSDLALYQRQAQQAADPELRTLAQKTVRLLRAHLKMAQAAQQQIGSTGDVARSSGAR